jgi:hypothetical protein
VAVNWKDWLTSCSFALAAGVIAGTLHGALGQPAPLHPAVPGADSAVLPAPEGNSQLTRPHPGSVQTGQRPASGGSARPGHLAPTAQPDPARKAPAKAGPARGAAGQSAGAGAPAVPVRTPSTPATPTDPGTPPDPGTSSEPGTPTQPAPPTGSGDPTDPGQPSDPAA